MTPRLALFDCDGTLVDGQHAVVSAMEKAFAELGLPAPDRHQVRRIVRLSLPQAVRVILPPVGNEFITLLKDSSLVSVVAVADMTRRGREFQAATFTSIEPWIMVALLYLVMTLFSARIVTWIERKTRLER